MAAEPSADLMAAADDEHFDTSSLVRLGAWGIGAVIALITVIIVSSTATGGKRASAALDSFRSPPPRPTAAQLLAQAKETESDPRRLSDAVRLLNADRDRLVTRLSALERNLEDLTGSIVRSPAAEKDLSATPPQAPAVGRDAPGRSMQTLEQALRNAKPTPEPAEPATPQTLSSTPPSPAAPSAKRAPITAAPQQPPAQSAIAPSIISPTPISSSAALVPSTSPPGATPPTPSPDAPASALTPAAATPAPVGAPAGTPPENIAALSAPGLAPPRLVVAPSETPKIELPPVAAPIVAPAPQPSPPPAMPASRAPKLASPPSLPLLHVHAAVPTDRVDRPARAVRKRTTPSKVVPMEAAADSVATKTEFAVDLGGAPTIDGLRQLWSSIRSNQSGLVDHLRPVIAVRERDTGPVELRLVVGPLTNAAAAARLCASFSSAGRACESTVFDGQKLALR